MNSYAKAAQSASKYLGEAHPMTSNLNEVLSQATKKIAGLIQKSISKNHIESRVGRTTEDLESLIRREDLD